MCGNKVGVFLVDDNPTFLRSISHFLDTDPSIEIIGTATSGAGALDQVVMMRPDLVLVDFAMPELNGMEVVARIKSQPAAPCVLIVTIYATDEHHALALAAGADGFISKSELGERLLPLIHAMFCV